MQSLMSKSSQSSFSNSGRMSLACRMPRTSSTSSPITGKRECCDSMTIGRNCRGVASARTQTSCERGTMTSRACMSEMLIPPNRMFSTSTSIRSRSAAKRRVSISSERDVGSPENMSATRSRKRRPPPRSSYSESLIAVGSPVRIVDAKAIQYGDFEPFHHLRLARLFVIAAAQMQHAVHDQVRVVVGLRFALLRGFGCDDRRTDDHVAEPALVAVRHDDVGPERQHVGRSFPLSKPFVEIGHFGSADDANAEIARLVDLRECGSRPATQLGRARHRVDVGRDLY